MVAINDKSHESRLPWGLSTTERRDEFPAYGVSSGCQEHA
jgi:hypothetical protein